MLARLASDLIPPPPPLLLILFPLLLFRMAEEGQRRGGRKTKKPELWRRSQQKKELRNLRKALRVEQRKLPLPLQQPSPHLHPEQANLLSSGKWVKKDTSTRLIPCLLGHLDIINTIINIGTIIILLTCIHIGMVDFKNSIVYNMLTCILAWLTSKISA